MPGMSSASPIGYEIYSDLLSTPEMREVFSEEATIRSWLKTWAAMARAQAEHGLIPKEASAKIAQAAASLAVVGSELANERVR